MRRGLDGAESVIVLGDGAAWIWKLSEWHFPRAVQVLDYWHATRHLWEAGGGLLNAPKLKMRHVGAFN